MTQDLAHPSIEDVARGLRPRYQRALLRVIRGEDVCVHVGRLAQVFAQLEARAGHGVVRRLWWLCGGLTEALLDQGITLDVQSKRLLGRIDREIKRLAEQGEQVLMDQPSLDVMDDIEALVRGAESQGPRVRVIRAQRDDMVDAPHATERPAQRPGASAGVAAGVREALTALADRLRGRHDMPTRTPAALQSAITALDGVVDALVPLELDVPRAVLKEQRALLRGWLEGGSQPSEHRLLAVVAALDQVASMLIPAGRDRLEQDAALPSGSADATRGRGTPYRAAAQVVVHDAWSGLDQIETGLDRRAQPDEDAGVRSILGLFERVRSDLIMLQMHRAADYLEVIRRCLDRAPTEPLTGTVLDGLREAAGALREYLEATAAHRPDRTAFLAAAQCALDSVGLAAPTREPTGGDHHPSLRADEPMPVMGDASARWPQTMPWPGMSTASAASSTAVRERVRVGEPEEGSTAPDDLLDAGQDADAWPDAALAPAIASHLEALREAAAATPADGTADPTGALRTSLKRIQESALLAGLLEMGDLTGVLGRYLTELHDRGLPLEEEDRVVLAQTAAAVDWSLEDLERARLEPADIGDLLDRIAARFSARVAPSLGFPEPGPAEPWPGSGADAVVDTGGETPSEAEPEGRNRDLRALFVAEAGALRNEVRADLGRWREHAAEPWLALPEEEAEPRPPVGGLDLGMAEMAGQLDALRVRLEEQLGGFRNGVVELEAAADGLYRQWQRLAADPAYHGRLTDALLATVSDLRAIEDALAGRVRATSGVLFRQSQVNAALQEGLVGQRMLSVDGVVARLEATVRATAEAAGRQVEMVVEGGQVELDRGVLGRLADPLEQLVRRALAHGIETPDERLARGKPPSGRVTVAWTRRGRVAQLRVSDDGRGIDLDALRAWITQRDLVSLDEATGPRDLLQLILEPSLGIAVGDAPALVQLEGAGAIALATKQLGGRLDLEAGPGEGVSWLVQLPATALVSVLLVHVGDEPYAIPTVQLAGTGRVRAADLGVEGIGGGLYAYDGQGYRIRPMSELLGMGPWASPRSQSTLPVLLVECGEQRLALVADDLAGRRDSAIEPLGAQLATVPGVAGGTDLGDGRVTLVLDLLGLVRRDLATGHGARMSVERDQAPAGEARITVLVVDASFALRTAIARALREAGVEVITARDGIEGVQRLRGAAPDVVVVDAGLPGLDGYAFARRVRGDRRWRHLPIVMTRWGDEPDAGEQDAAVRIGRRLAKPYAPSALLGLIRELIAVEPPA